MFSIKKIYHTINQLLSDYQQFGPKIFFVS